MTDLLKTAIESVQKLSPEKQDEYARVLLDALNETPYALSHEEQKSVQEGLADADMNRVAPTEHVHALFAKYLSI